MATAYIDSLGRKYKVMPGLGQNTFKARCQKPDHHGTIGWKCVPVLPWRATFEEAQADLDAYARRKGWAVFPRYQPEEETP